jgi:dGTPase
MVKSIIHASEGRNVIEMEPHIRKMTDELHAFLFENVYKNPIAKGEEGKAEEMLEKLYYFFFKNPDRLPAEYRKTADAEGVGRAVCDYIACMTDRYAVNLYKQLFIPDPWRG